MTANLIEKLNQNAHLTPDEIVNALTPNKWIRLMDMTGQQADMLNNQRCVVGADNGGEPNPFWIVAGSPDEDWTFERRYWYDVERRPSEFWFILHEDYTYGLVPDCFA